MPSSTQDDTERYADEDFATPATTTEAYNFGKVTGFALRSRMSREQFFRHDEHERPFGRHGVWIAYCKGFAKGRSSRRTRDGRRASDPRRG